MIKGIQYVGVFVGLYLILHLFTKKNYKIFNLVEIFKILVWISMVTLFFNPSYINYLQPILNTSDMISSIIIIGLLLAYIFISNIYTKIENLEKKINTLIQDYSVSKYLIKYEKSESDE